MRHMLCGQCIVWKVVSAKILLMTFRMFLSVCAKLIPNCQSFKWAEPSCIMWSTMVYFHVLNRWFWMKSWSHHYVSLIWRDSVSERKHTTWLCLWKAKWTFMYDIGMSVKPRLLCSTGHPWCDDLVAAFHNGLHELEETNMIQISMDGPSPNLKLLSKVQNERQKNKLSSLIDTGSCNLHLIHGAFKTGSEESSWDLHMGFPCKTRRLLQPNWFWQVPPSVLLNMMGRRQKRIRKVGKQEQHHTEVTLITNYKVHHQTVMNTGIK